MASQSEDEAPANREEVQVILQASQGDASIEASARAITVLISGKSENTVIAVEFRTVPLDLLQCFHLALRSSYFYSLLVVCDCKPG